MRLEFFGLIPPVVYLYNSVFFDNSPPVQEIAFSRDGIPSLFFVPPFHDLHPRQQRLRGGSGEAGFDPLPAHDMLHYERAKSRVPLAYPGTVHNRWVTEEQQHFSIRVPPVTILYQDTAANFTTLFHFCHRRHLQNLLKT
jgi:hypothetical protein